ncbi:MAG: Era-like GTP-binding protein, partial [bacterium]
MTLWGRLRNIMPGWHSSTSPPENATDSTADHLELARESLSELLDDSRVPEAVRQSLASDYDEVQKMLDKITHGHIHIAVFGRVSVGKSALLNALLGQTRFATSPLHGETRTSQSQLWQEYHAGNTYLIDTPGIDEIDGDARAQLARSVAARADLILFVIDGDLTNTELEALRELRTLGRPLLLVLNKTDRYTAAQLTDLQAAISAHIQEIVSPDNFLLATADPAPQVVITINENGSESESQREIPVDIEQVQQRIWEILDAEGKTLAA